MRIVVHESTKKSTIITSKLVCLALSVCCMPCHPTPKLLIRMQIPNFCASSHPLPSDCVSNFALYLFHLLMVPNFLLKLDFLSR